MATLLLILLVPLWGMIGFHLYLVVNKKMSLAWEAVLLSAYFGDATYRAINDLLS